MTRKKVSVSIGIPAYNEEANIKNLLESVLKQKEKSFKIKEIIVVLDGCSDNTWQKVGEIKDKRIHIFENKKRKGQAWCQNKIFALADSEIVVLLEADTLPENSDYLVKLIEPILKNHLTGLVQGNFSPMKGESILERTLFVQISIYKKLNLDRPTDVYVLSSGRGGRAFNRSVYKKLVFPRSAPEDVYALLWCKSKNIKVVYQKTAICLYRCPQTISDYAKERLKIDSEKLTIRRFFPATLINKIYERSIIYRLKSFGQFLTAHPIEFFYYLYLSASANMLILPMKLRNNGFSDYWPTVPSTKKLSL